MDCICNGVLNEGGINSNCQFIFMSITRLSFYCKEGLNPAIFCPAGLSHWVWLPACLHPWELGINGLQPTCLHSKGCGLLLSLRVLPTNRQILWLERWDWFKRAWFISMQVHNSKTDFSNACGSFGSCSLRCYPSHLTLLTESCSLFLCSPWRSPPNRGFSHPKAENAEAPENGFPLSPALRG